MRESVVQLEDNPDYTRDLQKSTATVTIYEKACSARYEKPPKNLSLRMAKKYVETYSSSNAEAQDPEERVQMNVTHRRNSPNCTY